MKDDDETLKRIEDEKKLTQQEIEILDKNILNMADIISNIRKQHFKNAEGKMAEEDALLERNNDTEWEIEQLKEKVRAARLTEVKLMEEVETLEYDLRAKQEKSASLCSSQLPENRRINAEA